MLNTERNSTTPICNVDMNVSLISHVKFPSSGQAATVVAFCFAFDGSIFQVGEDVYSCFADSLYLRKKKLPNPEYCINLVLS